MAQGYKTGGRQKGTPNKVTGTVREMISKSISRELESLPKLLNQLEPKERIEALIKLLPYTLPKADNKNITEDKSISNESGWIQDITKHIIKASLEKQAS